VILIEAPKNLVFVGHTRSPLTRSETRMIAQS
jgi:hypothetical protein